LAIEPGISLPYDEIAGSREGLDRSGDSVALRDEIAGSRGRLASNSRLRRPHRRNHALVNRAPASSRLRRCRRLNCDLARPGPREFAVTPMPPPPSPPIPDAG